jgi:thymidylate synthase (FAD)
MTDSPTVDSLFAAKSGLIFEGLPAIHSTPRFTQAGTAYLQAPGVVLLARPHVSLAGMAGFVSGFPSELNFSSYLEDPDTLSSAAQLCKVAGQTCYLSLGPGRTRNVGARRYFENIKSSGHGSVLEHATFSFLFYGVSRSFTHELVRHRAGTAFSQTSQRYVDGKVLRFVERPEYQDSSVLHQQFEQGIDASAREYAKRTDELLAQQSAGEQLLSGEARTDLRKKVQQAARSCLPNEAEAPIVFSANVRALRHIIEMRASRHAEIEIREVFLRAFLCLAKIEPILFDDYRVDPIPDGTFGVTTEYAKV